MKILSSCEAGYQPNFKPLPIKPLNIAHLIPKILNSKIINPREGLLLNVPVQKFRNWKTGSGQYLVAFFQTILKKEEKEGKRERGSH